MNVVYQTLLETETALSYLNTVYGSITTVVNLYQAYINENPDDYAYFEKTIAGFDIKVTLSKDCYEISIDISGVSIELYYDIENEESCGRIQLTNLNVIKYEMKEDYLLIAVNLLNLSLTQIEFIKEDDITFGYLYEFKGIESKNIKTSALICVEGDYTTIVSNKRETDDLLIKADIEVYSNETGYLVGERVLETVTKVNFDTLWFNLNDITGITSVKVEDKANGSNLDTIYVNGSTNSLVAKKVGGIGLKMLSRKYDIEMKVMYYYTYDDVTKKYEQVSFEVPMLFVQAEQLSTFTEDIYSSNSSNGVLNTTSINLLSSEMTEINTNCINLVPAYELLKEILTYADIKNYTAK